MKFLHTADLHIGKRIYGYSLLEDQRHVLAQIAEYAARPACDAVLVAGDIYDKPAPAAEAVALADWFFTALAKTGKPVLAIPGNHDAPERIACYAEILQDSRLYLARVFDGTVQKVTLSDEHGEVDVWLLPYLKPAMVRGHYPDAKIESYHDALRAVLAAAAPDPARRNLLLAHQFVTGAQLAGSEELVVGSLENVGADLFGAFDYVTLGHIHRAQAAGREAVRYAGAPLAYSFPEGSAAETVARAPSVTLVTLGEKGKVETETLPLSPLRGMRVLRGTLKELMARPFTEDYVKVVLQDEQLPNDAVGTLRMNYPNLMSFTAESAGGPVELEGEALQDAGQKTPDELFAAFYAEAAGRPLGKAEKQAAAGIFTRLTEGGA